MKFFILILSISCFGLNVRAEEPIFQWPPKSRIQTNFKLFGKKQPPAYNVAGSNETEVVQVKTVELARKAFRKWETHNHGIQMQGNYMKVTYQTFYSDGTSVVWDRDYRS